MKSKVILSLVSALVGGGIGFASGWFIKQKLDDKLFQQIKEELYAENEDDDLIDDENDVPEKPAVTEEEAAEKLRKYSGRYVIHEEPKKEEPKKPTGPVIIDVETYEDDVNDFNNWDKQEYTFYAHRTEQCPNGLLVDAMTGLKVMDPTYDIGQEALDVLRGISEGADGTIYVRNPWLGCDIMVTVCWDELSDEEREYMEDVGNALEEGGVKG